MGNTERLSSLNGLRQMPKEQEEESAVNLKVPKNDDKKVSLNLIVKYQLILDEDHS